MEKLIRLMKDNCHLTPMSDFDASCELSMQDYIDHVESGMIMDQDGNGQYAFAGQATGISVYPDAFEDEGLVFTIYAKRTKTEKENHITIDGVEIDHTITRQYAEVFEFTLTPEQALALPLSVIWYNR